MKNFFNKIENINFSISQWMWGFLGIIYVRFFFEALSNKTPTGIIPSDPYALVHVGLFFLTIYLGQALILNTFIRDVRKTFSVTLFLLPVIWIAPILDIIFSKGRGYIMYYFFATGGDLILSAVNFFTPSYMHGITYGMRISYIVLIGLSTIYIYQKTKSGQKAAAGTLLLFTFMFIIGSIPSLIYIAGNHNAFVDNTAPINISNYVQYKILDSNITHNTLHDGILSVTPLRFVEIGLDKLMSQILFILSLILSTFVLYALDKQKLLAVIKNCRPERIAYYLLPLIVAMLFAYDAGYGKLNLSMDISGMICLLMSWFGMWMFSVHLNDVADVNIDKITNQNRPIIKNRLSTWEMNQASFVFLCMALLGAWSAGFYPFFMVVVGLIISYIYSMPPLRLRTYPVISTFLISTVIVCAALSGFYFVSQNKDIHLFSPLISISIILIYTLQLNFKDLKDIEGDKKDGIMTLPVIFERNGRKIVGLCVFFSYIIIPYLFSLYLLYIIAIPIAFLGYKYAIKNPYRELPFFLLNYSFIALTIILSYSLSYIGKYF